MVFRLSSFELQGLVERLRLREYTSDGPGDIDRSLPKRFALSRLFRLALRYSAQEPRAKVISRVPICRGLLGGKLPDRLRCISCLWAKHQVRLDWRRTERQGAASLLSTASGLF